MDAAAQEEPKKENPFSISRKHQPMERNQTLLTEAAGRAGSRTAAESQSRLFISFLHTHRFGSYLKMCAQSEIDGAFAILTQASIYE